MAPVTKGGTEFDPAALERTEKRFFRELFDAPPAAVADAHELHRADFGPVQATVAVSLPGVRTLNLVLGAEAVDAAPEGFLDGAIEWARGQGAAAFPLLAPERPGSAAAAAALTAAGFEPGVAWMRFVRDAHPPRFEVAAEVEVVELDGSEEDAPFATIAALGFGLPEWTGSLFAALPGRPDWRCYLARVDGEPQGCAAMLLDGEVAELGIAATLEGGRRRGCQLALLRRRIEDAAADGARTLFVETSARVPGRPSTSYANILRAGFEEAYLSQGWTDARLPAG
jgi:GNAT superfamily N-acetyltransferase